MGWPGTPSYCGCSYMVRSWWQDGSAGRAGAALLWACWGHQTRCCGGDGPCGTVPQPSPAAPGGGHNQASRCDTAAGLC